MTNPLTREDLELAAKAAGLRLNVEGSNQWIADEFGQSIRFWNPYTSDGDALRLAVKLHMSLDLRSLDPNVSSVALGYRITEISTATEREAATRLAITRAAIEIGKAMK